MGQSFAPPARRPEVGAPLRWVLAQRGAGHRLFQQTPAPPSAPFKSTPEPGAERCRSGYSPAEEDAVKPAHSSRPVVAGGPRQANRTSDRLRLVGLPDDP